MIIITQHLTVSFKTHTTMKNCDMLSLFTTKVVFFFSLQTALLRSCTWISMSSLTLCLLPEHVLESHVFNLMQMCHLLAPQKKNKKKNRARDLSLWKLFLWRENPHPRFWKYCCSEYSCVCNILAHQVSVCTDVEVKTCWIITESWALNRNVFLLSKAMGLCGVNWWLDRARLSWRRKRHWTLMDSYHSPENGFYFCRGPQDIFFHLKSDLKVSLENN